MKKDIEHDRYVKGIHERMLWNVVAGIGIVLAMFLAQVLTSCEQEPSPITDKTGNDTTQEGGNCTDGPKPAPWRPGMDGSTTAQPAEPDGEEGKDETQEPGNSESAEEPDESQNESTDNDTTQGESAGGVVDPMK